MRKQRKKGRERKKENGREGGRENGREEGRIDLIWSPLLRHIPALSRLKAGDILTNVTTSQQGCLRPLPGTPLGGESSGADKRKDPAEIAATGQESSLPVRSEVTSTILRGQFQITAIKQVSQ